MKNKPTRRVRAAAITAAVLLAATAAAVPSNAATLAPQSSGSLAAEMNQLLELNPGGVQVSDNAIIWPDSMTVSVWPSPGNDTASDGLGENLRWDALRQIGITSVTDEFGVQDVYGCPSGLTVKDYY